MMIVTLNYKNEEGDWTRYSRSISKDDLAELIRELDTMADVYESVGQ